MRQFIIADLKIHKEPIKQTNFFLNKVIYRNHETIYHSKHIKIDYNLNKTT